MNKIKTILIDDMPLAIESLKADLLEYHNNEIEIVATAGGVMEAAKVIKKLRPELLFLDIHMGDGDGFDLLEIIEQGNIAVVFTTASKDFAIQAFQFSAVDYLLKPIDPELLKQSISKVKAFLNKSEDERSLDYISISTHDEIRRINVNDILRLEAMGNYTQFFLDDGSKILVTKTLKDYDEALGADFIRVHQSHLVNLKHIKAYIKTEGGYIEMKDESHVPVSVRKKPMVMQLLLK
ncbi:MAG: LytTR family DNA-binding domain-containing protein [Bacteroidia bacterium]|nr:LytTR family DNA-binding domain-containing protein [Bacteroidia bacterium]